MKGCDGIRCSEFTLRGCLVVPQHPDAVQAIVDVLSSVLVGAKLERARIRAFMQPRIAAIILREFQTGMRETLRTEPVNRHLLVCVALHVHVLAD